MLERFRDKTRDEFAENLNAAGIGAVLAGRKRPEEKIGRTLYRRSMGIIKITADSPIRFINVIKRDSTAQFPKQWWFHLVAPTGNPIPKSRSVDIQTDRKSSLAMLQDKAEEIWKNKDGDHRLARDISSNKEFTPLVLDMGNIRIRTLHGDFSGWSIEIDNKFEMSAERWKTLEMIAQTCVKSATDS